METTTEINLFTVSFTTGESIRGTEFELDDKKRQENNYEVKFFTGRNIRLTMQNSSVFKASDKVNVRNVFLCLSDVIHVASYLKSSNLDPQ